jgi:hypothetical protein
MRSTLTIGAIFCLMSCGGGSSAPPRYTISGTVTSAVTGLAAPQVSVSLSGAVPTKTTATDTGGH